MIQRMAIIENDEILYHQGRIPRIANEFHPWMFFFRLQRVQEERSRRTTNRFPDESIPLANNNHSLSSTLSTHVRHVDQGAYNTYAPSLTDTTGTHLNYYSTNPAAAPFIYNLSSLSTASYPNHQPLLGPSYGNESLNCCYGPAYGSYLPINGNGEEKVHSTTSDTLLGSNEEINDSGMKSESSSNELKSTPPHPTVSSSNDNQSNLFGGKRRDSNTAKPRWKIGDACFALWSEDGQVKSFPNRFFSPKISISLL